MKWNKTSETLELVHKVELNLDVESVRGMAFTEQDETIIVTSCINFCSGRIQAFKIMDGSTMWEVCGKVKREIVDPGGVSCDNCGNVFVADRINERLLLLKSRTGKLLQVLLKEDKGRVWDVYWTKTEPQLRVSHRYGFRISCYDIYFRS